MIPGATPQKIHVLSVKIAFFSTIMLLIVLLLGAFILKIFGITLPIVLISGGLLLFYVGWQILNAPIAPSFDGVTSDSVDLTIEKDPFTH